MMWTAVDNVDSRGRIRYAHWSMAGRSGFEGDGPHPVVVRKDLTVSLRSAIQESLVTMKDRSPDAFAQAGAFFGGGFVRADDGKYQIVRDMNDAARKLAAQR